jgi:DNA-binding MarR family transcriptional regulator
MTTSSLPDCLYYLVTRASMLATSMLKKDLSDAGVGHVKPAFLGVLVVLWQEDGLQAADVARRGGLEPSTTTGLLDRLEAQGLIERRADPADRRAVRIHLTRDGKRLERTVRGVVDMALARAAEGIPAKDVETTRCVLKRFLQNALERSRG